MAEQISRELLEGIEAKRWAGWLPRERNLAEELHVSRSTLRQSLRLLRAQGVIETLHSRGNRIVAQGAKSRVKYQRPTVVNLVVPGGTWRLPRTPISWADELRLQLAARGCQLQVLHSESCYSRRPDRALERLISQNPADCWVVRLSTLPFQQWLEKHEIPVILAGTAYSDITLPYIDVDHRALSRHATGLVVAGGHRRLALLMDSDIKAGDVENERGFHEAAQATSHRADLQTTVLRYERGKVGMIRALDGLLRRPERSTALLVPYATYCMTIWSHLALRGLKVPDDMSVVAHIGAAELSYLTPGPTYYRLNIEAYAQRILRLILTRMSGGNVPPRTLMLPELVRGESIAPPKMA